MATLNELYNQYLLAYKPGATVGGISSLTEMKPQQNIGGGSDSGFTFSTPTKEESEYAMDQGMTDVGENRFRGLGNMVMGGIISAINPVLGMAYSLSDPNSMTRQVLGGIGFNPTTEGSINGPFGGYNGFTGTEGTFSTDTSDTGATQSNQNSVDTDAQDADQSGGPAGSTSGTDAAGDGGDGYAYGGRVNYLQGGLISLLGNYYGKR